MNKRRKRIRKRHGRKKWLKWMRKLKRKRALRRRNKLIRLKMGWIEYKRIGNKKKKGWKISGVLMMCKRMIGNEFVIIKIKLNFLRYNLIYQKRSYQQLGLYLFLFLIFRNFNLIIFVLWFMNIWKVKFIFN